MYSVDVVFIGGGCGGDVVDCCVLLCLIKKENQNIFKWYVQVARTDYYYTFCVHIKNVE